MPPEPDKGGGHLGGVWPGCLHVMLLPQYSKLTFLKQEWLKQADDFDKLSIWSSTKQSYSEGHWLKLLPEPPPAPLLLLPAGNY